MSVNKQRKYFRSSIHELREICNSQKKNDSILKEVFDELQHRKTKGAVELRDKLQAYLSKNSDERQDKAGSNKKNNSGKIIIDYSDLEQFEFLSELLTKR